MLPGVVRCSRLGRLQSVRPRISHADRLSHVHCLNVDLENGHAVCLLHEHCDVNAYRDPYWHWVIHGHPYILVFEHLLDDSEPDDHIDELSDAFDDGD